MAPPNFSPSKEETLSIDNFIEEIEKRPLLYNKNLKDYSDLNMKKKMWEEVCEAVVPDWNQLNVGEKTKQGLDLQKKWANLRTCFRREVNVQKNTKPGKGTKRRKYIYFEKLLFLLPHMKNQEIEGYLGENESQSYNEDDDNTEPATSTPITKRQKTTHFIQMNTTQRKPEISIESSEVPSNSIDEDTHFALSIVSSLQNLSPEEKLDAKMGILNVFKQIAVARRYDTTPQTTTKYEILQQPFDDM